LLTFFLYPEEGDDTLSWNVGRLSKDYTYYILHKQPWTKGSGWSSSVGVVCGANNPHLKNKLIT
jgi:hypothetical protein